MHVDPHPDDNSRWQGRIAPFFAMLAVSVLQAHAAVSTCRPSDSDFACRLRSVLSLLQTAAVILGTLLVIAVLAAVRAYKRKPRKITPDDITPDARYPDARSSGCRPNNPAPDPGGHPYEAGIPAATAQDASGDCR